MENEEPKHVRRDRYKGTHPKSFKSKYKEQQPERYAEDVKKVISQGRTPAGMHRSICVDEILEILQIKPGQTGLDATLGYGGHSVEMLQCLLPNGKLYATDVDPIELPKTTARLAALGYNEDIFISKKMNFAGINVLVYESGLFDFILADLGLSSMQIDNPERGFSIKMDGPLDLRLNPNKGKSAADFLKTVSKIKLEELFIENADEPNASEIADAIVTAISNKQAVETTAQLKKIITETLSQELFRLDKDEIKKACQRCFQAIRIEINNEFSVLDQFLESLPTTLKPGGRVAILSFHSGEDRRVKKSFQHFFREGMYSKISDGFTRASVEECSSNPRAKSAKLRWAIMS